MTQSPFDHGGNRARATADRHIPLSKGNVNVWAVPQGRRQWAAFVGGLALGLLPFILALLLRL
jgi:hypothetical protein